MTLHHRWYTVTLDDSPYEEQRFAEMDLATRSVELCHQRHPEGVPRIDEVSTIGPDENDCWLIRQGGVRQFSHAPEPSMNVSSTAYLAALSSPRSQVTFQGEKIIGFITLHEISINEEVVPV